MTIHLYCVGTALHAFAHLTALLDLLQTIAAWLIGRASRMMGRFGLIIFMTALLPVCLDDAFAQVQKGQTQTMPILNRPFPTIPIQFGDVLLAIPEVWIDSKFLHLYGRDGRWSSLQFVNAHHRASPRTPYFDVPPLSQFVIGVPAAGLANDNIKRRREEVEARWAERRPDENGFWNWKPREYLQVTRTHARPYDQPLVLLCSTGSKLLQANYCTVQFYWTLMTSVRYRFVVPDIPESQWAQLDQRVLELLQFLDAGQPASNPH